MIKITRWDQLKGHKPLISLIRRNLELGRTSQCILFYGPTGLGKTSISKLMAVELVSKGDSKYFAQSVKSVILEDKSTESIKLFNMSDMGEREEEIRKVKSELDLGFSGRDVKVVILDESHNMSKKAQDAILPELEHLPKGVHVILITTEETSLREALVGRCSRYRLSNLSSIEISKLIKQEITMRGLRFQMAEKNAIAIIAAYSKCQARDVIKLLDEFPDNNIITNESLSVFMQTEIALSVIQLVKYLYGSMLLGLNYIKDLEVDSMLPKVLSEVLRVALGGSSDIMSQQEETTLRQILVGEDVSTLIGFASEVLSNRSITERSITAAFLKYHKTMIAQPVVDRTGEHSYMSDLATMNSMHREETGVAITDAERTQSVESFEDLIFGSKEIIK